MVDLVGVRVAVRFVASALHRAQFSARPAALSPNFPGWIDFHRLKFAIRLLRLESRPGFNCSMCEMWQTSLVTPLLASRRIHQITALKYSDTVGRKALAPNAALPRLARTDEITYCLINGAHSLILNRCWTQFDVQLGADPVPAGKFVRLIMFLFFQTCQDVDPGDFLLPFLFGRG